MGPFAASPHARLSCGSGRACLARHRLRRTPVEIPLVLICLGHAAFSIALTAAIAASVTAAGPQPGGGRPRTSSSRLAYVTQKLARLMSEPALPAAAHPSPASQQRTTPTAPTTRPFALDHPVPRRARQDQHADRAHLSSRPPATHPRPGDQRRPAPQRHAIASHAQDTTGSRPRSTSVFDRRIRAGRERPRPSRRI